MSTFEDGQNTTQSTQNNNRQLTPLKEESGDEGEDQHQQKLDREDATTGSNNNSIMGKMKKLSSILPDSLSRWFSPGRDGAKTIVGEDHQYNGQPTTKRKRGRRRIRLEADEDDSPASGFDADDGAEAQGLDFDEVALADNIAEHDLAAEDEQTRCNEYNNVYLFRKRRPVGNNNTRNVANDVDVDDDEDDDDEEEEDEVPEVEGFEYDIDRLGGPPRPATKRRRVEGEKVVTLRGLRNLPVLVSSTPDHHQQQQQGHSHRYAPHRLTHMNLYGNQRQREPYYNFFAGTEAAVATSGDLPFSTRRSLNIYSTDRSQQTLPTYKRQSLLTHHTRAKATPWRTSTTIDDVPEVSPAATATTTPTDPDNNNDFCPKANNNNNNIISTKRPSENHLESSESGEREGSGVAAGHISGNLGLGRPSPLHHQQHYGSNSNLDFYGNLQSAKSIFNRSSASGVVGGHHYHHHNSTLSLNSLSRRRRFNASIYGSTSALSDSRLLSSSASATLTGGGLASSSPFYQGRTTFGGNSANNRNFSQGNLSSASSLLAINSGGSSPAHPSSALTVLSQSPSIGSSNVRHIGISHNLPSSSESTQNQTTESHVPSEANSGGLSHTARRILQLLEKYSTPLTDAKRMGSTIREHQVSRQVRGQQLTPYARPSSSSTTTANSNSTKTPASLRPDNLLQEMYETVERRRLHRVTQSSRKLVQSPTKHQIKLMPLPSRQLQDSTIVAAPSTATVSTSSATGTYNSGSVSTTASSLASAPGEQQPHNHTNKMRSRLSHQVRKDMHSNQEEAPAPFDLPQLSFPQMANAPKFDLIIKPTPSVAPVVIPPVQQTPVTTNSTGVSGKPRRIFTFTAPQPLPPAVENDGNQGVIVPNAKLQSKRNFTFVPPVGLLEDLTTTTTLSMASTQDVQPSVNGASSGFALQFKKSTKEWECDTCMIRNPESSNKCAACESPKPGPSPAPASVPAPAPPITQTAFPAASQGFGQLFKKSATAWECDACMLTNKEEAVKCIACETPRKSLTKSSTSSSSTLTSSSSAPPLAPAPVVSFGFGDAFKPKANTWECPTCMVTNQSTASECIACQTHNPKSTSASNAVSETSTFKIGTTPKQDEKFQQLVASQKSSKWDCDACMAQNEMTRSKCICCDSLKPGSKSPESTAATTSAAATVPTFSFGFGAIKETKTSTASTSLTTTATSNPQPVFSFGQNTKPAASFGSPSNQFKFGIQKTDKVKTEDEKKNQQGAKMVSFSVNPEQQQEKSTTDTSTTGFVFKSPTASTIATATTSSTTTSSTTLSGFSFGSSPVVSSASSTVSSSTPSTISGSAIKPMFQFTPTSVVANASTSKVSSSTQPANTQGAGLSSLFGVTTATTATVTPTPAPAPVAAGGLFSFGSQPKASTPAVGLSSTSTSSPAKPNTFFFGQQPTNSTDVTPAVNSNSIFGAAAATSNSTTLTTAKPTVTPLGGFSFGENKAVKSTDTTTSTTSLPVKSSTAGFTFGSSGAGALGATSFGWPISNGGGTASTNSTTTAISSFSTTTTPAMAAAVVSSSTTTSSSSPTATPHVFGRSVFGSTTPASGNLFGLGGAGANASGATAAAAASPAPAMSILGGSSGTTASISSVFGSISNPFGSSQMAPGAAIAPNPVAPTQQPTAGATTNIFGSAATTSVTPVAAAPAATPAFGAGGGFAAATAATTAKPAFNFGSAATSVGTALTPGPFNFGASANVASTGGGVVGSIKPAFNFTGSATVATPQTATFNFTGNSGPLTGAAAASGNTGHQSDVFGAHQQQSQAQQRVFQFGGVASDGNAASTAAAPPLPISSTNVPAMFNFTATPTQMQSTAPFQFSASAPSASASATTNIFAFNSPSTGNSSQNSAQMGRRKIRTTMRRLPPR